MCKSVRHIPQPNVRTMTSPGAAIGAGTSASTSGDRYLSRTAALIVRFPHVGDAAVGQPLVHYMNTMTILRIWPCASIGCQGTSPGDAKLTASGGGQEEGRLPCRQHLQWLGPDDTARFI